MNYLKQMKMSLSSKDFKIRCSAIGQIMTNDRSGKGMGKTAMGYCENWLKEALYGKTKDFTSKYTEKGNIAESDSIELLGEHLDIMMFKNTEFVNNEYITGTADIVLKDVVIDTKTSWDCFTFPLFETKPDKNYVYQLQGYMELYHKQKAMLAYCLVDTPEEIVDKEISREMYKLDIDVFTPELHEAFTQRYIFSNVPIKYRVKTFEFEYDSDMIRAIEARVIQCREYIDLLIKNLG